MIGRGCRGRVQSLKETCQLCSGAAISGRQLPASSQLEQRTKAQDTTVSKVASFKAPPPPSVLGPMDPANQYPFLDEKVAVMQLCRMITSSIDDYAD